MNILAMLIAVAKTLAASTATTVDDYLVGVFEFAVSDPKFQDFFKRKPAPTTITPAGLMALTAGDEPEVEALFERFKNSPAGGQAGAPPTGERLKKLVGIFLQVVAIFKTLQGAGVLTPAALQQ